ncbi:MAG TPA: IS200/IS605 family transposase, partial [Spirochaetia bacterium]|nr:IS200/IS605 family transposase [Spirochaetia bacterium]
MVWNCKYHIVFLPKYRYKFFSQEVKEAERDEIKKL